MVKEWKAALEPYDLNDSLCSQIFMAAAHGAVEVLAEQYKIRNVAYANLLKSPSFPVLSAQSANIDRSQVQLGSTHGLAYSTRNFVEEHTTGIAYSPNDAKSDIMPHEVPPPLTRRAFRHTKALKQTSESLQGLGLDCWLRIVEAAKGRDQGDSTPDKRVRTGYSEDTEISQARPLNMAHDGPSASSKTSGAQRERRRTSFVSGTDAFSEYELARLKRVKANHAMLRSLGTEDSLSLTQR